MATDKNKLPKQVKLSAKEADGLKQRVKDKSLSTKDVEILLGLISFNAWLQDRLSRAKLTIKKLRKLFGFKSESSESVDKPTENESSSDDNDDSDKTTEETPADNAQDDNEKQNALVESSKWDSEKNHGRTAADAYVGCPLIEVQLDDELLKEMLCPICAESNTVAHLTQEDPKVLVFLEGNPLISGCRCQLQRLRCSICLTYFIAELPEEFKGRPKYAHSSISTLAIYHYYAGMPFKRIEKLQQLQGVPLADATQYDKINAFYKKSIKPVVFALRQCASDGSTLFFDDTIGRILEQTINNKNASTRKDKKSIHATAILSENNGHSIYLFDTNTKTAGKQLASLLENRQSTDNFQTMSDASSSNFPELEDNLMARWTIALCLAHGRRKFHELLDDGGGGDDDTRLILKIIADVYHNERHCKDNNLSDEERLAYHQKHSAHLMEALRTWFNNLLLHKEVEPNSRFGEAITYMLKRWVWLTQFLRVLGANLDNNICEIAIKVLIRYRNNSRFYKTFYGATIGDAIMSLSHTAAAANINIFDYFNALQQYSDHVQAGPENWLPWNFQQTIIELDMPIVCAAEN